MSSPYYYLILTAIFLTTCGYAALLRHVYEAKNADCVPYLALLPILVSLLIFLFIAFVRKYPIHLMLYIIALVSIMGILNMKRNAPASKK
jgi:accessory gene regulator protein AgrB